MRIPSGVTDQYVYFLATLAGTPVTGLSSFTVYWSRNGGAAAADASVTVNETDSTNMPGVYEYLVTEGTTIDSGDDEQEYVLYITATGMDPVVKTLSIYRPKITAGNTLGVASDGDISGNVDGNLIGYAGNLLAISGSATAANNMEVVFDTDFATNYNVTDNAWVTNGNSFIGTGWNTGKTGYSLTATTGLGNQTANITGNLSGSVGSVTGAVGSVTGSVGSVTGAVGSVTGNVGGIAGTITTLDALDTAQDSQHGTTQSAIGALNDLDAAGVATAVWNAATVTYGGAGTYGQAVEDTLADTNELQTNQGNWLTATGFATAVEMAKVPKSDGTVSWNASALADINAQCDLALSDYGANTTTPPTAGAIADQVWNELQADHVAAGSFGVIAAEIAEILVDTAEIGAAGAGLTAINLPDQTMNITGNITGNLSGNVGGIAGTIQTLDALDTAQDTQHSTTQGHLTDIKGGTFSGATDSLESIRDRGDAAWTTGAGGNPPQLLQSTTIATLASQTSFTLTAGSADDDAYNNAIVVVTDQSTSTQKAVGTVSDYTGLTRTVTLSADPGIFTMAVGDTIEIIAALGSAGSAPTAVQIRQEMDSNSTQLAAIVADTNELQTDDIPTTLATLATAAELAKVPKSDGTASWNATALAAINAEADTAISDASLATAAEIADAVLDEALAGHVTAGTLGKAVTDIETDATAILADTADMQPKLGSPAADISADIAAVKSETAAIVDDTGTNGVVIASAQLTAIADAILNRDFSAVSDTNARTLLNAARLLRNKYSVAGVTLTVTKEDDATAAWTSQLTTDASANPVTGSDPA